MKKTKPPYMPTEKEIRFRARMLLAMQRLGWDDKIITSAMIYDHPNLDTINRLLDQYGDEEAYSRIERFFQWESV